MGRSYEYINLVFVVDVAYWVRLCYITQSFERFVPIVDITKKAD
jgi:hypothetical protein